MGRPILQAKLMSGDAGTGEPFCSGQEGEDFNWTLFTGNATYESHHCMYWETENSGNFSSLPVQKWTPSSRRASSPSQSRQVRKTGEGRLQRHQDSRRGAWAARMKHRQQHAHEQGVGHGAPAAKAQSASGVGGGAGCAALGLVAPRNRHFSGASDLWEAVPPADVQGEREGKRSKKPRVYCKGMV